MFLVLIETSGNQDYIFATNKLRENVGASELTYRAGTEFVLKAVASQTAANQNCPDLWCEDPRQLRERLRSGELSHKVGDAHPVEVVIATSGKALLLVKEEKIGRAIIAEATRRALIEAPAIDLCGVVRKLSDESTIGREIRELHRDFEEFRGRRPGPQTRFPTLPVAAACSSSGGPAYDFVREGSGERALSRSSDAKWQHSAQWLKRIGEVFGTGRFPRDLRELERDFEAEQWIAVIHADGNGLGRVFLDFEAYIGAVDDRYRGYVETLRKFSLELEEATEAAFDAALQAVAREGSVKVPVVPLVLGGDDLTAISSGQVALQFALTFLEGFERETSTRPTLATVAGRAFGGCRRLSACAGVAVVKPHFPFHAAYELAEQLLQSAKAVKKHVLHAKNGEDPYPCSAMDFHVLFDSTFTSLRQIRDRLIVDTHQQSATHLTAKPYVVTSLEDLAEADRDWAERHHWSGLQQRITALQRTDDGRRSLPSSQVHSLRHGLFEGRQAADSRMRLVRNRYEDEGLEELLEETKKRGTLFRQASLKDGLCFETRFLDALEASGFWPRPADGDDRR